MVVGEGQKGIGLWEVIQRVIGAVSCGAVSLAAYLVLKRVSENLPHSNVQPKL